jgi:hypothetical protein
MDFFYDGQIRRYITQMVRLLSSFSVEDAHGNLTQVPVMYGDLTRQVANIIRDNSENKIPSAPRMSVYVTGLEMDRARTADSSLISKVHIRERAYDSNNNEYLNNQGKNYTVERAMPSPYTLKMTVDIWASNTEQKLQILEQILVLFNPSFEIQTTDNYIDWTSLSVVDLEGITFSSRSIPVGVDSEIDVAQMQFSTPIYITPPTKVKRLGVVTNIISNMFSESTGSIDLGFNLSVGVQDGAEPVFNAVRTTESSSGGESETVVDRGEFPNTSDGIMDINTEFRWDGSVSASTYQNYGLMVLDGSAQLISKNVVGEVDWEELVEALPGTYRAGVSRIYLKTDETDNYIAGTFTINPLDTTTIVIDFDELRDDTAITGPAGTRTSIDYIVDPLRFDPNQDKSAGIRLMLLGDIGNINNSDGADAWKNNDGTDFIASENDIVEWDGSAWNIVFDASETTTVTYTTNLNTNYQYKWTGEYWIRSYEGEYSGGTWGMQLDG